MAPNVPLTKRQARAAETGEQLLAAARDVFETRGYGATTVGAITKAANTAHGTFYLHFRNKEDAFFKVMASVLDEMYARTTPQEDHPPSLDATRESVAGYIEVFAAHRGLWRCLLEGILQNPTIEAVWLKMRQPFVDRTAKNIARAAGDGRARDVDFQRAASALCSMCEWHAFTNFTLRHRDDEDDVDTVVATLADLWFHSVYLPPGKEGPAAAQNP